MSYGNNLLQLNHDTCKFKFKDLKYKFKIKKQVLWFKKQIGRFKDQVYKFEDQIQSIFYSKLSICNLNEHKLNQSPTVASRQVKPKSKPALKIHQYINQVKIEIRP